MESEALIFGTSSRASEARPGISLNTPRTFVPRVRYAECSGRSQYCLRQTGMTAHNEASS